MNTIKTYRELLTLPTYEQRFRYLRLSGSIGIETFGHNRYLNQSFYNSKEWRDFRRYIILRDGGCDLGLRDRIIHDDDVIHIHHINPLTFDQVYGNLEALLDDNNVITTRAETHRAIHYGSEEYLMADSFTERVPFDTCPWRKGGISNAGIVVSNNI